MKVLNKTLYDALCRDRGEVLVKHEGCLPGYTLPDKADGLTLSKAAVKGPRFGKLVPEQWGEIYNCRCPVCGDNSKHLFISHALGAKLKDKDGKVVQFSQYAGYVCHRRHCNLTPWIRGLQLPHDVWLEPANAKLISGGDVLFASLRKAGQATMPDPNLCITDPRTPEAVRAYLRSRNIDPEALADKYKVRYAPVGAEYKYLNKDGEERTDTMQEARLIFPIIMHGRLQSWQSRRVFESPDGNHKKYLFPWDTPKQAYLYNFDNALMHTDVAITEGVMKVARIGDHCMATFGKSLSETQALLLKRVFDYDGRCCIVYDPDAYAKGEDVKAAKKLLEAKAFKRGVAVLRLRGTLQPEDRDPDEINAMLEEAWKQAVLTVEAIETQGIYTEPDLLVLEELADAYRQRKLDTASAPTQIELDLEADRKALAATSSDARFDEEGWITDEEE